MSKRPEDSVKVGPTELGREPKDEGVKTGQCVRARSTVPLLGLFTSVLDQALESKTLLRKKLLPIEYGRS